FCTLDIPNAPTYSKYSDTASAVAVDNLTPDTVRYLVGEYTASDSLIKITWEPPANTPDIAGYWVCPEYPTGTRYRLAHSSPVTRTIYYWPVPAGWPDTVPAGIAVAAMDYSGHISNWVLRYVILKSSVAISDNPSATGLNNSPKLIYDSFRNLLHTVYTDNNTVIYKNSNNEGISWANETNLGDGFYPGLTKDNNNELHCVWVNLIPAPPPPDPTQPKTFYLPWEQFTWQLKYCYTHNGQWQTEDTKIIDVFTKIVPTPVSMHFSAPSITTTSDSVHIFMEKTAYVLGPGPANWRWLWQLCYYSFPKGNPDLLNYTVIDSAYEYFPPPPHLVPDSLVKISDPSCVSDRYNSLHIAYTIRSEIRYQNKTGANWTGPQVISPLGIYDQPCIGINNDEITVVWAGNPMPGPGSQILCRRKFINSAWGSVERLDKGTNISVFPICLNNQVLWSEQIDSINYEIYYSRLSGYTWTEPENLSNTLRRSILPQAAFYRGPRQSTLYYLFTDGNEPPYYLFTGKKVFKTDEIPVYAIDLGAETPSSATIQRDGFLVYGEEAYKTVDYDSTELIYSLSGLEPSGKYEIEWDWYYESNQDWHERLRIDDIFNEHKWVPSGERVTIRKPIPQAVIQDGIMEITNEITGGNGLAVLSGFAILDAGEQGGGPQGEEAQFTGAFYLDRIYPNPAKGMIRIRFNSPDNRRVAVKLYDVCGRLMHKEDIKKSRIGMNEIIVRPGGFSAGVYFVRLEAGDFKKTEKAIMLK
ncbi:MAG: T9SS type A sorting domain-containing protein, partial [candidate division WOR-3 bacterium]